MIGVQHAVVGLAEGVGGGEGDVLDVVAGAGLVLEEVVEVLAVEVAFLAGSGHIDDVAVVIGVADADLHRGVQIIVVAVQAAVQRDGFAVGVLVGFKGQLVQGIVAVAGGAVVEVVILQVALGKGFLVLAVVIIVKHAVGGLVAAVRIEAHEPEAVVGVFVIEQLLEIVPVKVHGLAGFHLVGQIAVSAGAAVIDFKFHGAADVAVVAVQPEIHRDGLAVGVLVGFKGQLVQGIVAVAGGAVVEIIVSQAALVEGRLVAALIIVVEHAVGGLVAAVGIEAHVPEGAVPATGVKDVLEVVPVQGHRVAGVYPIGDGSVVGHGVHGVVGGVGRDRR